MSETRPEAGEQIWVAAPPVGKASHAPSVCYSQEYADEYSAMGWIVRGPYEAARDVERELDRMGDSFHVKAIKASEVVVGDVIWNEVDFVPVNEVDPSGININFWHTGDAGEKVLASWATLDDLVLVVAPEPSQVEVERLREALTELAAAASDISVLGYVSPHDLTKSADRRAKSKRYLDAMEVARALTVPPRE